MRLQGVLAALGLFLGPVTPNPDAKRLYDDLLSNYNRLIRPVSNHTEKVTVKLGLRLSQLVDLVRLLFMIVTLVLHMLISFISYPFTVD